MKLHAFALAAAFALPVLANAQEPKPTPDTTKSATDVKSAKLSDNDVKIISHVHHVNQMEISLAKIAQKNGSAQVKNYASTLESDHQNLDKDLTAFAKSHKVSTIPVEKPATDAERQDDKDRTAVISRMKTLKAPDFDKEYLNMVVTGHDKEVAKLESASSSIENSDLKTMLDDRVKPVLQRHADQARDLQKAPQASTGGTGRAPTQPQR